MPYDVSFFLLNRDGSYRCALPSAASFTLSPIVHEAGGVKFDYPVTGRNFALLREHSDANSDVELAVWVDGQDSGLTVLLMAEDSDDVDEAAVWSFSGHFGEVRLEDAVIEPRTDVVVPPDGPPPTEDTAAYRAYSATAGTIMRTLLQEADARGTLTDLDWSTFSNATDSAGAAWSKVITLKIAPGVNYLEVAQALVSYDLCEFRMVGRSLRMFNPGTSAVDHTVGGPVPPVVLRRGRDITDSPRKRSVREAATDLLVAGGEGLYRRVFDSTARARFGRQREQYRSVGSITDGGALLAYAAIEMARAKDGKLSITHGLTFARPDTPRPLIDFRPGDWVWSDTGRPGGLERLQAVQVTIVGDSGGAQTGSASLNDLVASREAQLARRIKGIEGGSTLTGTSQARPAAEGPDLIAPGAPQGVIVDSEAQPSPELVPRSAVSAVWGEVITNADGSVIEDLDHYIVEWRYLDPALVTNWRQLPPVRDPSAAWSDVVAGEPIEVRVLAVDRAGNRSDWSTPSGFHTTQTDGTAPPIPSALVVSEFLGTLTVGWDGLGALGEPMPGDFDEAHIYRGTSELFEDAVYLDNLGGAGQRNYPDLPIDVRQHFWLVTVDRTGNTSFESAVAFGTPRLIGFGDIAFSNPGNLVEDGSFELAGSRATHLARSDPAWSFVEGSVGSLADHGEWFARVTGSVGTGRRGLFLSDIIPVVPGDQLAFRFALRGVGANGDVSAVIRWFDAAGVAIMDNLLFFTPADSTGVWLAKEVPSYTAPAGAAGYRVVVEGAANFTAGTWDVDRVEVREMIGTLLIRNAAITDAKIVSASVGKLTAGTFTAVMTNSGTVQSGPAGVGVARYRLDANGLTFFDAAGNAAITLDRATASAMLTGTVQTGRVGQRAVLSGTGGDLRFYPQVGETRYGRLFSFIPSNHPNDVAIEMRASDADTVDVFARLQIMPEVAFLVVNKSSNETAHRAGVQVIEDNVLIAVRVGQTSNVYDGGFAELNRNGSTQFGRSKGSAFSSLIFDANGDTRFSNAVGTTGAGFAFMAQGSDPEGYRFVIAGASLAIVRNSNNEYVSLSQGGGAFKAFVIDHPTNPDRWLVHACTEGPTAGVEYHGEVDIVDHGAVVELPAWFEAATRAEGRQVQLTAIVPDEPADLPAVPGDPPVPTRAQRGRRKAAAQDGPGRGRGAPSAPVPDVVDVDDEVDDHPGQPGTPPVPEWSRLPMVAASVPRNGQFRITCSTPTARVAWRVFAVRADVDLFDAEPLRADVDVAGFGPYRTLTARAA